MYLNREEIIRDKEQAIKNLGEIARSGELDLKTILLVLATSGFKDYTDLELEGIIDDWKREVVSKRGI